MGPDFLFPLLFIAQSLVAGGPLVVLDDATRDWFETARADRADVLILGDSVVLFGTHGWDDGFNRAIGSKFGLAATGLHWEDRAGSELRLRALPDWNLDPAAAPAGLPSFAVQSRVFSPPEEEPAQLGFRVGPESELAEGPASLVVWGASASGADDLTAAVRIGGPPFSLLFQAEPQSLRGMDGGPRVLEFTIPEAVRLGGREVFVEGADDSSFIYTRLERPRATGGSVTSIGYGGQTTHAFYNDVWVGGSWTEAGRARFLQNIVRGGSGKLMVPIFEGFNDRNERRPSLTKRIVPGDSPAAFLDNIDTLVRQIRQDWATAGGGKEDISFVVFGMYQIAPPESQELRAYRRMMQVYAQQTPGVSFVDLRPLIPEYNIARPAGLLSDGIHLSQEGSELVSDRVINLLYGEVCPGDIADETGYGPVDGMVGAGDFLRLTEMFGLCDYGGVGCVGDIADHTGFGPPDGAVDFGDLFAMTFYRGPCP